MLEDAINGKQEGLWPWPILCCWWADEIPLWQPGYSDSGTRSKVGVKHSVVTFGLQYILYMKIDHCKALLSPRPWAVSSGSVNASRNSYFNLDS
jgi:hypothetical protein